MFEVLPLSSYVLSPTLLLLETFLGILLWNCFQCHCHVFLDVFNVLKSKADFIYGNSQKSFRAKSSGEQGGCSIPVINFWTRNCFDRECLVSWSIVMVENPIIGPKFRPFSTYSFMYQLHFFHIISLAVE